MLDALLNYLFGCSHERTTFPLTHTATFGNRQRTTYIACLNCGAEFVYDWFEPDVCESRRCCSKNLAVFADWAEVRSHLPSRDREHSLLIEQVLRAGA